MNERSRLTRNRPVEKARQAPGRKGFTLIEVLVALVILSTGILLVLRAFNTSLFALSECRDCLWANRLIRRKMTDMQADILEPGKGLPASSSGAFSGRHSDFRWRAEVNEMDLSREGGSNTNKMNQVVITVWRVGASRSYTVGTLMSTHNQR